MHDAARPLVDEDVIARVLAPLAEGWDGAVPGLPVADTVKRVGEDGTVLETVERRDLYAVADTPGVSCGRLQAGARGGCRRDDGLRGIVERAGGRVRVVEGDARLLKVTTPGDLRSVENLLAGN